MNRKELDFLLEQNQYLKGGTKEACAKIREFISQARTSGKQIDSARSCVEAEEFLNYVETLIAFVFEKRGRCFITTASFSC